MSPRLKIRRVALSLIFVGLIANVRGPAKAGHHTDGPAKAGRHIDGPAKAGHYVQEQQPTFRTEANYVRVDVYPTTRGVPVSDLVQDDFEVLEDRVLQKIEAFERVVIRGATPQDTRREPNSVSESRAMVEASRARVFVLFLDLNHVEPEASRTVRQPLINALNRLIGADDLIGVMTPEMSAADVTFARKTTTIEGILSRFWGERGLITPVDPRRQMYQRCFPGGGPTPACQDDDRGLADELIARHQERETLDALEDLVMFLRGVREERKAILAISDGWRLFRPNAALERRLYCSAPEGPKVTIDPRTGKLTTAQVRPGEPSTTQCDADRMVLSRMDSDEHLRRIFDLANRSNASFYPVDPRGMPVFDTSIAEPRTGLPARGTTTVTPPSVDRQLLQSRANSLRDLAVATDGLAIVGTNNLESGLQRVTDDLSSYYLLGYYSTGRFDGRFHSISVRVKRPGVQVRARRGYLAPTAAEVTASATRAVPKTAGVATGAVEPRALEAALSTLNGFVRDLPMRVRAAAGWRGDNTASIAVVGEIGSSDEWKAGADVDLSLISATGEMVASERAAIAAGSRAFRLTLTPVQPLAAGEYTIRVRTRGRAPSAPGANELITVTLGPSPAATGVIFLRRGPTTGNREVPTADLRFRRTEQLRLDIPTSGETPLSARLLDRTGRPVPLPVTTARRDDPDGSRWQTVQLALAPLAAGDYLIQLTGGAEISSLFAFRVVP